MRLHIERVYMGLGVQKQAMLVDGSFVVVFIFSLARDETALFLYKIRLQGSGEVARLSLKPAMLQAPGELPYGQAFTMNFDVCNASLVRTHVARNFPRTFSPTTSYHEIALTCVCLCLYIFIRMLKEHLLRFFAYTATCSRTGGVQDIAPLILYTKVSAAHGPCRPKGNNPPAPSLCFHHKPATCRSQAPTEFEFDQGSISIFSESDALSVVTGHRLPSPYNNVR